MGLQLKGEMCKVVVSKAINYEVYLHESSLAAASPNTKIIGNRAEREPINALLWRSLGSFDWLRVFRKSSVDNLNMARITSLLYILRYRIQSRR